MRTCVIGAGALGAWIGGRLALAKADVTLVDRGQQLEALTSRGLKLVENGGETAHTTAFTASTLEAAQGPYDLLILATKAHEILQAAPRLPRLMNDDSVLVTVQNGIPWWYFLRHGGEWDSLTLDSVDPQGRISAHIPAERVVGAVAYPAVTLEEPGIVRHMEGTRIPLGELDGTSSDRVERIAVLLRSAGFQSRVLDDVRSEIWLKALGTLALNPLSALTRATLGEICRFEPTRSLALRMMNEAWSVCERLGITPRHTPEHRLRGAESVGEHKTSMLQDVEAGRSLELEAVLGSVVELARLTEVSAPNLEAVYAATQLLTASLETPPAP